MSSKNPIISVSLISTKEAMDLAVDIRYRVFVIEQKVDHEIEYDEFEESSTHVLAELDGKAVGTARWRETELGYKLERFAVPIEFRGLGVGAALVNFVLDQLPTRSKAYLNSQVSAMGFYEKFGFRAVGDLFYEANIPHKKMVL